VTLNDPTTGTFDSIHAGTGKTVSVTGLLISGASASDYLLASSSTSAAVGTITPATLTAELTGTVSKTYNTTNSATLTANNYTLSGVLGDDVVTLNDPTTGTFDNVHVGTGKTVTVTGLALSGADASDYSLVATSTSGAVGTITPATLTAALTGTVSKPYDATTVATLAANNYTLSGVLGSDMVTLNDPTTGSYNSSQVGTGKTVSVTGLLISGADASDYVLASSSIAGPAGTITPAIGISGYVPTAGQHTGFAATSGVIGGEGGTPGGTPGGGTLSLAIPTTASLGNDTNSGSSSNGTSGAPGTADSGSTVASRDYCANGSNSGATTYCTAPDAEITVTMRRSATKQRAGAVSVSVPEEIVARGKTVRFPLPKEIAEVVGNDALQVTQKNGNSLASWLTYTPATKTFSANGVPVGALPTEFLLRSGAYGWTMNITERATR
jgi:hypothetical protein